MIIWIQQFFMQALIWLLGLIDGVGGVFAATSGIENVTVMNETANGTVQSSTTLTSYFLGLSGVQKAFWIVLIASVGICAVCTVVAIVKSMINISGKEQKSHARTIGQSLSTIIITLFMAMFMIVGITCSDKLLGTINKGINGGDELIMSHEIMNLSINQAYEMDDENIQGLNEYDQDGDVTLVAYMYKFVAQETDASKPKRYSELPEYNLIWDNYANCVVFYKNADEYYSDPTIIYDMRFGYDNLGNEIHTPYIKDYTLLILKDPRDGWYAENGKEALNKDILKENVSHIFGGVKTKFGIPQHWRYDGIVNPDAFNFLVAYICAVVLLIALVGAILGLVKRLFDLVLLFIVLPGIAATIPLDDGARFRLWRETVISKTFLAYGTVFAVNVFFIVAPSLWSVSIGGASEIMNTILRLVLICGGALTISGGQLLLSRLLGTSAEESREMTQSARALLGGAMSAGRMGRVATQMLFGAKNANGKRVGGLFRTGAKAAAAGGSMLGGMSTVLAGNAYKSSKLGRANSHVVDTLRAWGKQTEGYKTIGDGIHAAAQKYEDSSQLVARGGIVGELGRAGNSVKNKIVAPKPYGGGKLQPLSGSMLKNHKTIEKNRGSKK